MCKFCVCRWTSLLCFIDITARMWLSMLTRARAHTHKHVHSRVRHSRIDCMLIKTNKYLANRSTNNYVNILRTVFVVVLSHFCVVSVSTGKTVQTRLKSQRHFDSLRWLTWIPSLVSLQLFFRLFLAPLLPLCMPLHSARVVNFVWLAQQKKKWFFEVETRCTTKSNQ